MNFYYRFYILPMIRFLLIFSLSVKFSGRKLCCIGSCSLATTQGVCSANDLAIVGPTKYLKEIDFVL